MEAESLNRQITDSEIEAVIKKKFPAHKSPTPDGFMGECYHIFREKLTPAFSTYPKKI